MFLSIVIPCYNSGKYIGRLLQSVVDCEMDDIEVILADDCSPEDYQDKVDKFTDKLNIIQCRTPYNTGSPTNAREIGVALATGKYLMFMDHDDWLAPGGIKQFRDFVEANDYPEYVICGIRQCNEAGETEYEKFGCLDFLHGKFFRLDFYKQGNIHFKPDLLHKEDTWVTCQANCNCIKYNVEPKFTDFCTYCWYNNENSLSHRILREERGGNTELTMTRIKINLDIDYEIYFKFFDEGSLPLCVATEWFLRNLANYYFDIQLYHSCYEQAKPLFAKFYKDVKDRLGMTKEDILQYSFADDGWMFFDQLHEFMEFDTTGLEWHEDYPTFLSELEAYYD